MVLRKIFKRLVFITSVFAPLLLVFSQAEDLWKYSSFFSKHVRTWVYDIYYHSSFGSRSLVNSLLEKYYPGAVLCDRTWKWFDSDGDGKYLDLLIEFQECRTGEECPDPCVPWYAAIFVVENWSFRLVADFDLDDNFFQKTWTEGPFIVRTRSATAGSWMEVLVYLLTDGNVVEIDRLSDDFSGDQKTRYVEREGRLDIKTFEGYKSYYADQVKKKLDKHEVIKGLPTLIGTHELSKILRISPENEIELQIGNDKIKISTKSEGYGSSGMAEIPFFRIARIATEEKCEFHGFVQLNDFFREYALPPQKKSMEQNKDEFMIECTNKDADMSGTNPGGWSILIKVMPKNRWG